MFMAVCLTLSKISPESHRRSNISLKMAMLATFSSHLSSLPGSSPLVDSAGLCWSSSAGGATSWSDIHLQSLFVVKWEQFVHKLRTLNHKAGMFQPDTRRAHYLLWCEGHIYQPVRTGVMKSFFC